MPTPKGCPGYWWFVPPLLDLSIWRTVVKIHPRLSPDFTSGSVWLVFRAQVDRKPTLMTWTPTCGWIFSHLSYFTIVEENLLVTLHSSMFSRWGSHSRLLPYLLWSYISNLTRSCSFLYEANESHQTISHLRRLCHHCKRIDLLSYRRMYMYM